MLNEFKAFIARGNVIDLAVGFIMGAAFTAVVDSLVKDIIMALLGPILGGIDFSNLFVQLTGRDKIAATLKAAGDAGVVTLNIGLFINAVIKFLIIAWAVFMLVKAANKLMPKKEAAPSGPPPEVTLLGEIRDLLKAK
ncbi:MAG: large conductance mechanosensitive channel protein MscL [Alphaproteobacteria bacterium]|nr:large conductance mechanosensitive channel protein MscL [Alphaproteobacteria bacterium]